jgi:hypothetical protein
MNVNANFQVNNSKNKNSNVSHQSQVSGNYEAAKNLKIVSNQHLAEKINNVTRNCNLQSQPNKDKLGKQMQKEDETQNISTASGQVSIEQLKELMKNP